MPNKVINSILVMGDSVARGVVFHTEKKRYVFSKDGFIKKLTSVLRADVHNMSKFGMTSDYGRRILSEKLEEVDPDLVLIEYGGNDCDYKWDEVARDPTAVHLPNTSLKAFEQNIRRMVSLLKSLGKTPVLMNLPPLDAASYFSWFTKKDTECGRNVLKWLHDVSKIYWWQEKYSYTIEKIADSMNTHLVNVRGAFLRWPDYKALICEDGIHPNEAGQDLIERAFVEYIEKHAGYMMA
ncbi:MAG: SGNH/GDSL hydrolase family protein [Christensenella sp.]